MRCCARCLPIALPAPSRRRARLHESMQTQSPRRADVDDQVGRAIEPARDATERTGTVTLIAIEEHWIMPDLTAALRRMPLHLRDESLAFNEMGDHQQRLEDLGAGRIAAMDAQGIDVSILALTPPGTQPLPADGCHASEPRRERRRGCGRQQQSVPISIALHPAHVVTTGCRGRAGAGCRHRPRRHHGLRPIGRPPPRRPRLRRLLRRRVGARPTGVHPSPTAIACCS